MEIDWDIVSDDELNNELARRKDIIDGMADLSQIPIEYLISESEKRRIKKEKELKELEEWKGIEEYTILFNAIKTPDGTILSSKHRYDYITYRDSNTGEIYGVDGGPEYLRRIGNTSDCQDLSITDKTPFEEIRKKFHWGSRGKQGNEPLVMKCLCELTNEHIQAILDNVFKHKQESVFKLWFEKELSYRTQNEIYIA